MPNMLCVASPEPFGQKAVQWLAHCLRGRILEHSLRRRIEHHHILVRVDRDDSIHGRLKHPAQPLLALAQLLFRCLALADVARNLGEAPEGTMVVVHRSDYDVCPESRPVLPYSPCLLLQSSFA